MQHGGPSSIVFHVADAVLGAEPGVFPGNVEGVDQPARAEDLERAAGELVHPLNGPEESRVRR